MEMSTGIRAENMSKGVGKSGLNACTVYGGEFYDWYPRFDDFKSISEHHARLTQSFGEFSESIYSARVVRRHVRRLHHYVNVTVK